VDFLYKNYYFDSNEFDSHPIKSSAVYTYYALLSTIANSFNYRVDHHSVEHANSWSGIFFPEEYEYNTFISDGFYQ
jgi:hypothetical protein